MVCPYCNAPMRDGSRFCGRCGRHIGQERRVSSSTGALTPGTRLQGGRYSIKKVLGDGGAGSALLATDVRLDKQVVIKELLSNEANVAGWQEEVKHFKQEVAILAHVDHPLMPGVTDHFQEGMRYFMAQEYIEGETLEERLQTLQHPLQERDVLLYVSDILDLLAYLARLPTPLIHRDIKPANIILSDDEQGVHLVDFGIARAEQNKHERRKRTERFGTAGYAPPELYQGEADPRSDLYALAATMHHVLTNRDPRNYPPFLYPSVRSLNPQLSPELEQVLERALLRDKEQRYQSAAAMKQEIDTILRVRFGVVRDIPEVDVLPAGHIVTTAEVGGPRGGATLPVQRREQVANASFTPPPPPTDQPPLLPPIGALPTKKRRVNTGLLLLIGLLLLALLGVSIFGVFSFISPDSGQKPETAESHGIGSEMINGEKIGLSDGSVAFDVKRSGGVVKEQGAERFQKGDVSAAISLWKQASSQDTSDAETLIYLENQRVGNAPHVTIVVGTMLSGSDDEVGVGRDDLQGAYVAQKEFNDGAKLKGGVLVKLLIASSGSQNSYVTKVVQRIKEQMKQDPTIVGVMGWPLSGRALEAARLLKEVRLPMVSQTATSDDLTGISPYFFRIAPPSAVQGKAGAMYARKTLGVKKVALFQDKNDPYSQSLASDFAQEFQRLGGTIVTTVNYTIHKAETISEAMEQAMKPNPDMIYFAGYSGDVSTLLVNLPPGEMPVMGGDTLYELNGFQSSARANFHRLRFTSLAYPDEWDILAKGRPRPAFFSHYAAAFNPGGAHAPAYGYTRANNDVILSYDAMTALLLGCANVLKDGKEKVTPEALQVGLRKINGANAFQGISGQISFGADGDPLNKAIVILRVDDNGHIQMEPKIIGTYFL
uniref:non-specific serine/threonine protein kinase n=1 Tax=Thermosporothrix sp. COM3 TaxID=2490863 RepID=A0A455SPG5_9CHLR|nr:hypothetical protein KTC_40490 [Thermosporothrix sp. COM3]